MITALLVSLSPQVARFVAVDAQKVVLTHVRIIDGTGAPPFPDRNLTIENGKIVSIAPGADLASGEGVTALDLKGRTVMPGIVGMHDHLFQYARPNLAPDGTFERPAYFHEMPFSAPRLYLANGVTTIRTAGAIEPETDLRLRDGIEAGTLAGPHIEVTGPYLDGKDDARKTVAYWAERGIAWFKAYKNLTRKELEAAVDEAHKRDGRVTGHLCSITYPEAVAAGVDNFEHGFSVNTMLDPDKKPDLCSASSGDATLEHINPAQSAQLIALLVKHKVAVTSTLVSISFSAGRPDAPRAALDAMSPGLRAAYPAWRAEPPKPGGALLLRKEMDLERAFVAAGGLLVAGPDPGGFGGNLPGFGDHREIELLVEAGFSPVEAIRIATLNGATLLRRADRIGSIAPGKNADLVVVRGDPAARIADIENVELVFKDGAGYDPQKLLDSVKGRYGEY